MTTNEMQFDDEDVAVSSNSSRRNSSSVADKPAVTKKGRVHRYCPKEKDMKFSFECEWSNCGVKFETMDGFLQHIDEHLVEPATAPAPTNLECKWLQCDAKVFECESEYKRHVRFHAFHTKLKQIGQSVLKTLQDRHQLETNENDASSLNLNSSSAKNENLINSNNVPKCNLDEQTRNSIPELPFKFECAWDSCTYNTDNPELFYRHIRTQHVDTYPNDQLNSKCLWSQCEQIITNRNRFVEHIRHHSQEKLVACPNCGSLFSTFTKFIDHCSRSSQMGNLCYQCSHCNKRFATNNLLKEHIRKHVNKCKCPICDMTCIDKNDLSKHILYKHTTHKAFKCNYCDHSCKTQHDLQKHITLKHNERYEYQCNECEFKTKDLNNIKRHMLKFHISSEGSYIVNDGQQFSSSYMCHVCNKVYCQGSTLSRHLKTQHNFQWPSGHSRFRYKLESDGYYRLQTMRYESIELVEELNKSCKQNPLADISSSLQTLETTTNSVNNAADLLQQDASDNTTSNGSSNEVVTTYATQGIQFNLNNINYMDTTMDLDSLQQRSAQIDNQSTAFAQPSAKLDEIDEDADDAEEMNEYEPPQQQQQQQQPNYIIEEDDTDNVVFDNLHASGSLTNQFNSNLHYQVDNPAEQPKTPYDHPSVLQLDNNCKVTQVAYYNNHIINMTGSNQAPNIVDPSTENTTFDLENYLNLNLNLVKVNDNRVEMSNAPSMFNLTQTGLEHHQLVEFKPDIDNSMLTYTHLQQI